MSGAWLKTYRWFLWPLLLSILKLLAQAKGKDSKLARGLSMREPDSSGVAPWLKHPAKTRPIWIHCASFEFEYAKPVITAIKRREPQAKILVTYFSPTVAAAAEKYPGVDFACPSPWETPKALGEFIDHHQPQMLLIARTDTWPEMLAQARMARLPVLLFSATLAESSGRAKGVGRALSRAVFSDLTQIYCVGDEDRAVFESLGCGEKTRVAGDTRYDQVQARLANVKPLREELFSQARNVLIAGSTWEQDEAVLIEAARELGSEVQWVFVPHEPTQEHLRALEDSLKEAGLVSVRYSQAKSWNTGEILLVDQVGFLAELYLKGRFAFVGGSFRKTVHSVMEPLAAGCLTFVGPLHTNNREAIEFREILVSDSNQSGLACVQPVSGSRDLVSKLTEALRVFDSSGADRIKNEIQLRSGKSDLVAQWALERWQANA